MTGWLMGYAVPAVVGLPRALPLAKPFEAILQASRLVGKSPPLPVLVSQKFLVEHSVAAWIPI
jgi:hypothetical protein